MCYGDLLSIYRYVGNNELKAYTNPYVAAAWDRNWANPIYIDCCSLTFNGYYLEIPQRQSVTFKDRDIGTIYRYSEYNRFEQFEDNAHAASFDPILWQCPMRINYNFWITNKGPHSGLTIYGYVKNIPFTEGQSIRCLEDPTKIYRFTEHGGLRWYPNESIAKSWDPVNWKNPIETSCSDLVRVRIGQPMAAQVLEQGETVKCAGSSSIYRFENNQIRYYPTTELASAWDPYWECPKTIDCSRYAVGARISVKPISSLLQDFN